MLKRDISTLGLQLASSALTCCYSSLQSGKEIIDHGPLTKSRKTKFGDSRNRRRGTLGKKFVEELRAPTERVIRIASALEHTETRFIKEYPDKEISRVFLNLPLYDLPKINRAAQEFYVHPTSDVLSSQLRGYIADSFPNLSYGTIDRIVLTYIAILTEELALVDENFRENIRTIVELRAQQSQNYIQTQSALLEKLEALTIPKESPSSQSELTQTLRNVQNLLSQLQVPSQQSHKRLRS